jgi:hypothetical protein
VIELLIAIAGMVVVTGLAWGIFDETQKASAKMTRRQAAIDYAVAVQDEITNLLYSAVAPGNLDQPASVNSVFERERLAVPVYVHGAAAGLYVVEIRPAADQPDDAEGEPQSVYYEKLETPVAAATGSAPVSEKVTPLGGKTPDFKPRISLRYAASATPGQTAFLDTLGEGQWPALIELTIRIELPEYPTRPVLLTTAIVPGYLPPNEIALPETQAPAEAPAEQTESPPQPQEAP